MNQRPSGTVTFLFTDIEGSTRLWQDHPAEMAVTMSLHDEITQAIVDRHCGNVFFKAGDGVAVAFASAYEAVAAATDLQKELTSKVDVNGHPLGVRMGLNTGEAVERDGDYLGTAVNLAARVRDLARGGEVLLSASTRDLVYRALPDTEAIRKLRPRRLKGINHREPVYRLGRRNVDWPRAASKVALGVATSALIGVGAWAFYVMVDEDETTATTGSVTDTTEIEVESTRVDVPGPTSGLMTIEADTVLTSDHEGRIVIAAHEVVLDCDGHEVRNPEPVDRNGEPDHFDAGILVYQEDGVTVQNCVVVDHWTGIAAIQAERVWLHHNDLTHSTAPRDFTVRTGIGLTECAKCALNENTVTDIHGDAIDLYRTVDSVIYDNTVNAPGIAIRVIDCEYNTIRTNSLAMRPGGTLTGGGIGIGLFGRNAHNVIEDNTTRGFLIGIELNHEASNNQVRDNRGIFNGHDLAACPAHVETNIIEPETGNEVSNVEDVLGDPCPGGTDMTAPASYLAFTEPPSYSSMVVRSEQDGELPIKPSPTLAAPSKRP